MAIVVARLAEASGAEYPKGLPCRDREPHQALAAGSLGAFGRSLTATVPVAADRGLYEESAAGSSRSLPIGFLFILPVRRTSPRVCCARKPAAGPFQAAIAPRCGRVAANLDKAGPLAARGLKALLARKPAPLDSATPDLEAPVIPPVFSTAPEGRTGRSRPGPSGKPKERIPR